jgi:hypothetical protein
VRDINLSLQHKSHASACLLVWETPLLRLSGLFALSFDPTLSYLLTPHRRGVLVKPVDLLCNLDAFRKAIPTIHALRLCNQYGNGQGAGITKLPKELIGFIEEELLVSLRQEETRDGHGWAKKFGCFGRTCSPRDHIDKAHPMEYCDA